MQKIICELKNSNYSKGNKEKDEWKTQQINSVICRTTIRCQIHVIGI